MRERIRLKSSKSIPENVALGLRIVAVEPESGLRSRESRRGSRVSHGYVSLGLPIDIEKIAVGL